MGNQGYQGEVRAPGSVSRRVRKGLKLLYPISTQPNKLSDNQNVHHR